MRRFEILPSSRLRQDIQSIWAIEGVSLITAHEAILPDPYRELVFSCGTLATLEVAAGSRYKLPQIFLNGLQSTSVPLRTKEPSCLLGVRFFPWAVQSFLVHRHQFWIRRYAHCRVHGKHSQHRLHTLSITRVSRLRCTH